MTVHLIMALFNQVVVTTFLIAVFISACMGVDDDDEPTDQSIDQPINQTIDHPIDQPTASSRNLIKRSTRDRDCTTDKNSYGKKCLCTKPCLDIQGNMMCFTYGDRRKRSYCCKEPCKRYIRGPPLGGIKEYKCNAGRKLVICDPRKNTFEPWPKPTFATSVSWSDDYQYSFLLDSSSSPDYSSSSLGGPSSSRSSLVSTRFKGTTWSELAKGSYNYHQPIDDYVKPPKWIKACVGRKCKNKVIKW